MRGILFFGVSMAVLSATAAAVPLTVVEVSFPAINCLFDNDCTITVSDSTSPINLPHASGTGFLQSRTWPPGEAGTVGAGRVAYLYRVDLRAIGGLTALPCITELSVDFGTHQPLDFNGDGSPDDIFVGTGGGLGTIGLASADKVGDRITFRFSPAVCAGNAPGNGQSSFFFGLAGAGPPQPVAAEATISLGGSLDLEARAPGGSGGGGSGFIPCLPGLPVSADVPVCRCLRDPTLRELRCAALHPGFLLVRRTPIPLPPDRPFKVSWTLSPLSLQKGTVVVEDGLPPRFERPQGTPVKLEFELGGAGSQSQTREYELGTSLQEGTLGMSTLVTFSPGAQGSIATELFLPIGPLPWPSLDDVPSEPRPMPPADPDFGDDPCGQAADRLWQEHLAIFGDTFGPSIAEYRDLQDRAERCRRIRTRLYGDRAPFLACQGPGSRAFADCYLAGGDSSTCVAAAERAVADCMEDVRHGLGGVLGCLLSGRFPCP